VTDQKTKAHKRAARRRREEALRRERALALSGAAGTPPAAVSVNEFKRLTGASHATVSRWIRDGEIQSVRIGRRRFISFDEIARIRGERVEKAPR
jgi:excisionase family DNA binding protein